MRHPSSFIAALALSCGCGTSGMSMGMTLGATGQAASSTSVGSTSSTAGATTGATSSMSTGATSTTVGASSGGTTGAPTTASTSGSTTTGATSSSSTGSSSTGSSSTGGGPPVFPYVFHGAYASGVSYAPYTGTMGAPTLDPTTLFDGLPTLAVAIPTSGQIGGALVNAVPQDLSGYNALSFWVKASVALPLDQAELGNDGTDTTDLAQIDTLAVPTTWLQYYIPIPNPAAATSVDGLFGFLRSPRSPGATLWFAEISYVNIGDLGTAQPAIATEDVAHTVGQSFPVDGISVTFPISGADLTLAASGPGYFTFSSTHPAVASVSPAGVITALSNGATVVSAALGSIPAGGAIGVTVTGGATAPGPTTAAANPTDPDGGVICLLSAVYPDIVIDDYGAAWSNGGVGPNLTQSSLDGSPTNTYADLSYIGIEFYQETPSNAVDATQMAALHLDVWTAGSAAFGVKLVDFGNLPPGSPSVTQGEVDFGAPGFAPSTWNSLDIPLTSFESAGLTATPNDVSQLLLSSDGGGTYYVENIYFHR